MEGDKKIMLWCNDSPNQRALAVRLHQTFGLKAIIIEKKIYLKANRNKAVALKSKFREFVSFFKIHYAWRKMQEYYKKSYPVWPDVPLLIVSSINGKEAFEFALNHKPDIIAVSGTSLVKEPLLSIPASIGIINLHTGLSPYVKGGPNCTNWCIANDQWDLIGNTIMWINAGIDTGNLITTETINIKECKTLMDAHILVMNKAHELYCRAIKYLLSTDPPYISVPQKEIDKGQLFLSKMWNDEKKRLLIKNWKKRKIKEVKLSPRVVHLPKGF